MNKKLSKAVAIAVKKAVNPVGSKPTITSSKPLKKAPVKREMLDQSTACGMVATGACHIPPANRNKKSKL